MDKSDIQLVEPKSARRPIIDPLLLALKSRRVLIALVALIVGVLTLIVPELQAVQSEVLVLLITLALALIGGFSLEDAARAGRSASGNPKEDIPSLVKRVLNEWIDEAATPQSAAKRTDEHAHE